MKDGNPERGLVLRRRHYAAPDDLYRVQAALMDWVRVNGHYNLWHKGDIGHRLFNGCYGYDPAGMFHYWLNKQDEIGAFALFNPRGESFDLQVAPLCCTAICTLPYSNIAKARCCDWRSASICG